ncbi:MAG: type I-G CRISPR-associated helicase/endonuclease Cas3g [Thermoplasmataceae archaeon]
MDFIEFFKKATGFEPYPYQIRLGNSDEFPSVIDVPTGIGKTAAVIISWVWRRRFHANDKVRQNTPRRLVYCLPMRVLVEQTRNNAIFWLQQEGLLGGDAIFAHTDDVLELNSYKPTWKDGDKITVTTLMGGEDNYNWDIYPEHDEIIIGTQDMLLSRILNRGYGMSRYKWPVHFGLLNNDCLWVMDEIQLMGSGLITSVQMEAFRRHFGTVKNTQTVWMSATINHDWLKSVDYSDNSGKFTELKLEKEDKEIERIKKVLNCKKIVKKLEMKDYNYEFLSRRILEEHVSGTRTLVVLNTVERAKEVYLSLLKKKPDAELVLMHSHFRMEERKVVLSNILKNPGEKGMIVVSTQVVEAGLDLSSKTLFTEIAPASSMIQRFGRCNRYGEYSESKIFWIDQLESGKGNPLLPYSIEDLVVSQEFLQRIDGESLMQGTFAQLVSSLGEFDVIRPKDILELFNTSTDLTRQDLDISRFVRNERDSNIQVFWRTFTDNNWPKKEPMALSYELCSAPIRDMKEIIKKKKDVWSWDSFNGQWEKVTSSDSVFPGKIFLLNSSDGYYSTKEGWGINYTGKVSVPDSGSAELNDCYDDITSSVNDWKTIAQHTDEVVAVAEKITDRMNLPRNFADNVRDASRWHDAGKAHPSFQAMMRTDKMPPTRSGLMAKAPPDCWKGIGLPKDIKNSEGRRKNFRHELVSGLLALTNEQTDITAYLATSHHGKVRVSIRSMPEEYKPDIEDIKFACGVWDGDEIPEIDLGHNTIVKKTKMDLSVIEIGDSHMGPSWLDRVLKLCDDPDIGIFRLGYLESLVRAADRRASGGL